MLKYAEALEELRAAERFGTHPSLEGTRALTQVLSNPQDAYVSIQVTGTNGKSSTVRMIAALLAAHGVRTGAYLSPELESMTERIELAGSPVSELDFGRAISAALAAREGAWESGLLPPEFTITQFELITTAALWLFRARRVRVACLEVGMGGRWDATSVVTPAVAVITGVAIDHVEQLGATRDAIADDKSTIMKPGSVAVLGPGTSGMDVIFLRRAKDAGIGVVAVRAEGETSPVVEPRTVRYRLESSPDTPGGGTVMRVRGIFAEYAGVALRTPAYQAANAATAIAAVEIYLGCALDGDAARTALDAMVFPGRFELLRVHPPLVIDGAHNPQAAAVLAEAIRDAWPDDRVRPALLLGILADKDARGIAEALAPVACSVAVTRSTSPRALEVDTLATIVEQVGGRRPPEFPDVGAALEALVGASEAGLVVTGSITTAGDARRWVRERFGPA